MRLQPQGGFTFHDAIQPALPVRMGAEAELRDVNAPGNDAIGVEGPASYGPLSPFPSLYAPRPREGDALCARFEPGERLCADLPEPSIIGLGHHSFERRRWGYRLLPEGYDVLGLAAGDAGPKFDGKERVQSNVLEGSFTQVLMTDWSRGTPHRGRPGAPRPEGHAGTAVDLRERIRTDGSSARDVGGGWCSLSGDVDRALSVPAGGDLAPESARFTRWLVSELALLRPRS